MDCALTAVNGETRIALHTKERMLNIKDADKMPAVHAEVFITPGNTLYLQKPGVVMVSRPHVNLSGVAGFLAGFDRDLKFPEYLDDPTPISGTEALIKFAGQLCYYSFGANRTFNEKADEYFKNIKSSGHGCYDAATDVLTSCGWKPWPEVTTEDRLATLNKEGEIEYRKPVQVIKADYSGRMYRVESSGVDLLVTPNHRMFVCQTTTKLGRKRLWSSYRAITAQELDSTSCAYLKTGKWNYQPDPVQPVFSADELRFLGFAIGDGHYRGSGNQVMFHLHRERKISWLKAVASRLGWPMKESEDGTRFAVNADPIVLLLKQMYTVDGDKQIPQAEALLTRQSLSSLEGLLEGLLQSDGSEGRTGDSFDTTSPVLPGQLQQLCLHVGLAANEGYTLDEEHREASSSYGKKPLTRLHIIRRVLRPEVNKWDGQVGRSSWVENWSGEVFCAEMSEDTARVVYVRRNGQPVWCGNSVLEHANFSFLIYGVPRSFTHELVRHRAGAAFSQVSQRYVDGSTLRFVERPASAADPELHKMFLDWIDLSSVQYEKRAARLLALQQSGFAGLIGEKKRDLRKKINQDARACLPNEAEAPIFVTLNVRALRHVIEMRADSPADIEIRAVAMTLYSMALSQAPLLFNDYTVVPQPDGFPAVSTEYRKV